jgi:hypothetical protein
MKMALTLVSHSQLAKHPHYTHLPIPAKRFDVKRIESSRNLSVNAWLQQLWSRLLNSE